MSETNNDYSSFQAAPQVPELAKLTEHVATMRKLEDELEKIANDLKAKQEELRTLVSVTMPNLMDTLGLKEFVTLDGYKVEIKEDVQASIPEAHRPAAHRWLEANGHAGLIKRDITVSFNKNQQEAAQKLMDDLSTKFGAVTQKQAVHPSTLKAFVRGQLDEGIDVPLDLFGVFRQKQAKVSATGKKK